MAFTRKSAKDTARRVLADSANARHRFGFGGDPGSLIGDNAPKPSDLWFLEFNTVTNDGKNNVEQVGVLAKAVSPISIQTSSMPIDQYGKRVYVPTRVDFPEVSLTLYDDITGKMFDFCSDIYSKFFSNNNAEVSGMNAEEMLTGVGNHGRKIPEGKHKYFHQHFEKVTIYHFFGNLSPLTWGNVTEANALLQSNKHFKNEGTGHIQKIELINPLVTLIQFSGSDYSTTELRTVDLSLQPENVIIGKPEEVIFPDWMTLGMNYMMDHLYSPLYNRKKVDTYPEEFSEKMANITPKTKGELARLEALKEEQDSQDTQRKLAELMKLYNAGLKSVDDIEDFYLYGNEEGNAAARAALKERIGVINAEQANRFTKEPTKTFVDDFNKRDESTFKSTYKNPDVPSFGEIGASNPPIDKYPSFNTNLDDAMVQELVGSFFGQRDFNIKNVFDLKGQLRNAANSIQSNITNGVNSAIGDVLNIDGASLINGITRPVKRPAPPTGTTEKAFRDFPLEENVNLINTGKHSGVSKVIKYPIKKGPY